MHTIMFVKLVLPSGGAVGLGVLTTVRKNDIHTSMHARLNLFMARTLTGDSFTIKYVILGTCAGEPSCVSREHTDVTASTCITRIGYACKGEI